MMPFPARSTTNGQDFRTSKLLPVDYVLGENDVLCGSRGCRCFHHSGNQKLKKLVESYLFQYVSATTRLEKTSIIYQVIHQVRCNSPNGGFVKKDQSSGRYFEVGDHLAREKTSQAFRDAMDRNRNLNNTDEDVEVTSLSRKRKIKHEEIQTRASLYMDLIDNNISYRSSSLTATMGKATLPGYDDPDSFLHWLQQQEMNFKGHEEEEFSHVKKNCLTWKVETNSCQDVAEYECNRVNDNTLKDQQKVYDSSVSSFVSSSCENKDQGYMQGQNPLHGNNSMLQTPYYDNRTGISTNIGGNTTGKPVLEDERTFELLLKFAESSLRPDHQFAASLFEPMPLEE